MWIEFDNGFTTQATKASSNKNFLQQMDVIFETNDLHLFFENLLCRSPNFEDLWPNPDGSYGAAGFLVDHLGL